MIKKLSLAAILAMGSMSVASATTLTEAIENVQVSGYFRYRGTKKHDTSDNITHEYKTKFTFTLPVDANLKVVTGYIAKNNLDDGNTNTNAPLQNNKMYFQYSVDELCVKAGKMNLDTPLTDHDDDYGTALIAAYKSPSLTVIAGAVPSSTVTSNNIFLAGVKAKVNIAQFTLFGYHVKDISDKALFLEAKASMNNITGIAQFAYNDLHDGKSAQRFAALGASTKVNVASTTVNGTVAYLHFGKNGARVELGSDDTSLLKAGEQAGDLIGSSALGGGNAAALVLGAKVANFKVGADFVLVKGAVSNKNDANEYVLRAATKYNKNIKLSGYYSVLNVENGDYSRKIRLEAKYSF